MNPIDFDAIIERRASGSAKWNWFDHDVLPMWVADMDFRAPDALIAALHERLDHGVFGYQMDEPALRTTLVERLAARHAMQITPEQIVLLPGLVMGLNCISAIVGTSGDGVLTQTPIYPPFLSAPVNQGRTLQTAPLTVSHDGASLTYTLDMDALAAAVTPRTRLFLLCSPHNPIGRVWTRGELEQIADFCVRHDLIIASDEIHCDLTYSAPQHISIASLSPEIAARTITMLAPSKTFNIPGLGLSVLIVQDADLLKRMNEWRYGMGALVNALGLTAGLAAYRDGQPWLDQLMPYLQANRDLVIETIARDMPLLSMTVPDATYLAWIDCRALTLPDAQTPAAWFLEQGRVAFNDGATFGAGGAGFIRLNFAAPRATVIEGLARMKRAYDLLA
ncbi:MAG: PatB family C-S lyase [Chloroflexota bacterium]|nr:PatB family C-S lyase [Chloroflexota bacterium]